MADRVQYILDRMSSVFHQLIELKLFNESEVSSIISRRRDLEYLISRRQLQPSDYYTYIQYEVNLIKMYRLRVGKHDDPALRKQQRHVEALMIRHVSYVFERAIRRFPAELDLWMDYIGFLKESNSTTLLSNVLGKAIALYPKSETFWSLAAMHEIEANANTHAARILLQRGLRVNSDSKVLWKRYLEVELWNALRLIERQNALKLDYDESALLEVVSVVFRHAIAAVDSVEFAVELYHTVLSITSIGGQTAGSISLASSLETLLKQKFATSSHLWSQLSSTQASAILESQKSNPPLFSENLADVELAAIHSEAENMSKKRKNIEGTPIVSEDASLRAMDVIQKCESVISNTFTLFRSGYDEIVQSADVSQSLLSGFVSDACDGLQDVLNQNIRCLSTLALSNVKIEDVPYLVDGSTCLSSSSSTQVVDKKSSKKKRKGQSDADTEPAVIDGHGAGLQSLFIACYGCMEWLKNIAASLASVSIQIESVFVRLRLRFWLFVNQIRRLLAPGSVDLEDDESLASDTHSLSNNVLESSQWTIRHTIRWIESAASRIAACSAPSRSSVLGDNTKAHVPVLVSASLASNAAQATEDIAHWSKVVAFVIEICKLSQLTSSQDTSEEEPSEEVPSTLLPVLSLQSANMEIKSVTEVCLKYANIMASCAEGDDLMWQCIQIQHRLHLIAWSVAIQSIIRNCSCSAETRGVWCVRYLVSVLEIEEQNKISGTEMPDKLVTTPSDAKSDSSSDSDSDIDDKNRSAVCVRHISSFVELFEWLEQEIKRSPHVFKVHALASYYVAASQEALARAMVTAQANKRQSKLGIKLVQRGKDAKSNQSPHQLECDRCLKFARTVIERGIAACPQQSDIWDALERLEGLTGDLKSLNHVRWRRSKVVF